jgi:hypothetical protein
VRRRDNIDRFTSAIAEFQDELQSAVVELDEHSDDMRRSARRRLGDLFNSAGYPASVRDSFELSFDFPSVDPPAYLRSLNPELDQQECHRIKQRFDEAIRLTEASFTEVLARLVDHLAERLSGDDDGKPKIFRDSTVKNLSSFFDRFQSLSIHSDEQLDELVERTRDLMNGVDPTGLRRNSSVRQHPLATPVMTMQFVIEPDGIVGCVYRGMS